MKLFGYTVKLPLGWQIHVTHQHLAILRATPSYGYRSWKIEWSIGAQFRGVNHGWRNLWHKPQFHHLDLRIGSDLWMTLHGFRPATPTERQKALVRGWHICGLR